MNKRTKISLVLAITVILVILSVGLTSAAMPINASSCSINWMVIDKDGVPYVGLVMGTAVWSVEENTITKTCTGHIYLGETKFNRYYYDLDEMRAYLADTYSADVGKPFVIGPEETGGAQMSMIYKGYEFPSYDWTALVKPNGNFEYQGYFEIP